MAEYDLSDREWWTAEWLALLQKYRFKKRLERGRTYAKEGNVLQIDFDGPQVRARVRGTASEPYTLTIALDTFSEEDWAHVIATLSEKALYSAQLLAGEMPPDIQDVFAASGLSLFPYNLADVHSQCSCPDPQNPCKHVAAVYYQLGDRFSEDPFVLFQLRGRTRSQVLESIRAARSRQFSATEASETSEIHSLTPSTSTPTALDLERFWDCEPPPETKAIAPAGETKTILELLGAIPLNPADSQAIAQYLARVYELARQPEKTR